MYFIFSFSKQKIQISLKSKGVFSPSWDPDSKQQEKALFQGIPSRHSLTVMNGSRSSEKGRWGALISFGMQTASPVPRMSSSVAERWVKVALVTPVWVMSPYGALTHRPIQWAVRGEKTGHFFTLKLHCQKLQTETCIFSLKSHCSTQTENSWRLEGFSGSSFSKTTRNSAPISPWKKKSHSWYSKINWMRLCRSIASFKKIILNNYRMTSRMRSLIGVAEIILEKSITIQISIFQSHSTVNKTLQTLKALSLATGEGANEPLSGSCSWSLIW